MNKDYVYKRRLLKLADFLEKLPPRRFDFRKWVGDDWGGKPDLSCNTTACAFGWATTIPSFRRLGLVLTENDDRFSEFRFVVGLKGSTNSTYAGKVIFGLDYLEFEQLFVPGLEDNNQLSFFATAKQVAKHIKKFVAKKYP